MEEALRLTTSRVLKAVARMHDSGRSKSLIGARPSRALSAFSERAQVSRLLLAPHAATVHARARRTSHHAMARRGAQARHLKRTRHPSWQPARFKFASNPASLEARCHLKAKTGSVPSTASASYTRMILPLAL